MPSTNDYYNTEKTTFLVTELKYARKNKRYLTVDDQSVSYYTFSLFAMKKMKYLSDLSERTNQLTVVVFFTSDKSEILVRAELSRELLPWKHGKDGRQLNPIAAERCYSWTGVSH